MTTETIKAEPEDQPSADTQPPQPILPVDSAVTKAEKIERNAYEPDTDDRPAKKPKLSSPVPDARDDSRKGCVAIKPEYLIIRSSAPRSKPVDDRDRRDDRDLRDDDAAEEGGKADRKAGGKDKDKAGGRDKGKRPKNKGQNTARSFGSSRDITPLCATRQFANEFAPSTCRFGDKCKFEHDIRKYLTEGKRPDLDTFGAACPVLKATGTCHSGWKCRFAGSHSLERDTEDGRKELMLLEGTAPAEDSEDASTPGIFNIVAATHKFALNRKQMPFPKSVPYTLWLGSLSRETDNSHKSVESRSDHRASYKEQPFLPSEKRRLYYGPETPVLAPLTTQGNMPFRRLAIELGAEITWSEMAMSKSIISGHKGEWALLRAHESELQAPKYSPATPVPGYDHKRDFRFGTQISGSQPDWTLKATEVLTNLCPSLRAVDLNCGCPIDLVFRDGAGAALLDSPNKLERILRGMNAVSGEVPVTVKIRTGTKDNKPTSEKLVERLAFGGRESRELDIGPCGVAAITLHGRSRQQRYTRSADWSYIADCAAIIKRYNADFDRRLDTVREADPRTLASSKGNESRLYFIGNGDCYSHEDYNEHIALSGVDSVMVARGALMKPWIFEEISSGQHIDKSATERLAYIEKFARYGLEVWGSDEMGVGLTRRFLLEWLSFACRYVPAGILMHLPPRIQERPPSYRGRDDLETLLSSDNYKDWIKISEMFLGPAHENFRFEPKHKSNAYEDAEG